MDLKERRENMKKFFDEHIDSYDDVHQKFMGTKRMLTEALPEGTEAVLDLGAGTGLELFFLFERFPGARVTAMDVSPEMLFKLKERPFADRVTCILGDFFEADAGTGYDAVISTSALHHYFPEDKVILYRRIFDSVKSGGQFVNCDKIVFSEEQEMNPEQFEEEKTKRAHVDTPLAPGTEKRLLEQAGFVQIQILPTEQENYRLFVAVKP